MDNQSGFQFLLAVIAGVPSVLIIITAIYVAGTVRAQIKRNAEEIQRLEGKVDEHLHDAPEVQKLLTRLDERSDNFEHRLIRVEGKVNGK